MKNYEYIIASLPALSQDWKFPQDRNFSSYIEEIKALADGSDRKAIDALLSGFKDKNLNEEFYGKMLSCKDKFLKEYFAFDLQVRNGKARLSSQRRPSLRQPWRRQICWAERRHWTTSCGIRFPI